MAWQFNFEPDTIVVDDRVYNDYGLFGRWTSQGAYFVTRMKANTEYVIVRENVVPQKRHILKDEIIELTGLKAFDKCPYKLHRIEFYNSEKKEILVFLTNHLTIEASTIDAIYKDRWQMELFFKALKQNLKTKNFCWNQCQCGQNSNLDSIIDCHANPALPATALQVILVASEPCHLVPHESIYSSRPMGLVK